MNKFAVLLITIGLGWSGNAAAQEGWQGAWAHPPTELNDLSLRPDERPVRSGYQPLAPYKDTTVRQVVRLSASARAIRLRFSNEFGTKPLHIAAANIGLANEQGNIIPGTDHVITFEKSGSADIPPGAPLLSDAIIWPVPAFERLAVSIHYSSETVPPAHTLFALNAWQVEGDHRLDGTLQNPRPARSGIHLSQIDILPVRPGGTLVTFGDSVTEGVASTVGAFRGWPDRLAERLQADDATKGWTIANAGIGSNRLLHDTPSTNALARFDRDVLSVPGVKAVTVLLGINDIQYSHRYPAEAVRAPQEIAALRQLIDRAHAAGIRIYGATITPYEGSPDYTPEGEADRGALNSFIRSGAFDGVLDFDAALRDPDKPSRLRPDADSGGHLHPNDQGYRMMGDSIPLALFRTTH